MQNFDYQTPTRLIFGKDVIEKLPEVMSRIGKKVLLTYGGGSIKKIGLYDKVLELLKDFEIIELSGIQPNPKYDPSVLDGVRLCKEYDIDVILAVGGGSVLDCSKAIAAGAKYDGDPWDLISYKVKAKAALPIVDIITLAATGSEYDCGGVISRTETNDKIGYILLSKRRPCIFKTLILRNMISHFINAAFVNAHIFKVHRDTDRFKETVSIVYRLICNLEIIKAAVDTKHIHAVLYEASDCPVAQNVLHPSRRDYRKAFAVSNVIIRRKSVLHSMTRPARLTVSERINTIAAISANKHHFGSCCVVLRVFYTLLAVYHQTL